MHPNTAPPQTQRAVQLEESFTVAHLIHIFALKVQPEVLEVWAIVDVVAGRLAVVLEPVLSAHCDRQIDGGKQAQYRADHQRCGVTVVHHVFYVAKMTFRWLTIHCLVDEIGERCEEKGHNICTAFLFKHWFLFIFLCYPIQTLFSNSHGCETSWETK